MIMAFEIERFWGVCKSVVNNVDYLLILIFDEDVKK